MHAAVAKKAGLTFAGPCRRIHASLALPSTPGQLRLYNVHKSAHIANLSAVLLHYRQAYVALLDLTGIELRSPRVGTAAAVDDVSRRPGLSGCARGAVGYPVRVVKHGRRGGQTAR